ncbi:MAG: cbb3-type cytochrome oxidase assembly protein CcoS [Nitrospinota bacterium]
MALWLSLMALLMGAGAFLIFLWAIRTGQFRDVEKVKQKVLDAEGVKEEEGSQEKEGRGSA